jgi:ACS family hexuronate transporter-like MFS transporter
VLRGSLGPLPVPMDSDVRALLGVSRLKAWTLTVVAMLGLAITLVERQMLAALATTVTDALRISNVDYGLLSSIFALSYLVGSLGSGGLIPRLGPRAALAFTLAASSIGIALHGVATTFAGVAALRVALGIAVAPAFPCAIQAIHRVLPFRDRARGIGLLYLGNSLGSAACAPLAVVLASAFGWRSAFFSVGLIGVLWVPFWSLLTASGKLRETLDDPPLSVARAGSNPDAAEANRRRSSMLRLAADPGVLRGALVISAAAPVTTVMLIWGAKYLAHEHHLSQTEAGYYLWLPALFFGLGSIIFGEFRTRTAKNRNKVRPPRLLMFVAALLGVLMALVPFAGGPRACIVLASFAMAGSGGLYTLATSDMLVHAPRGAVPATTGLATFAQSVVYIVVSPLIGKIVDQSGTYLWVMVGAGLWIVPGCVYWFVDAFLHPDRAKRSPAAAAASLG